jgi:hypothetical protein
MSLPVLRKVLNRATEDPHFRRQLLENPEAALRGYRLSAVEKQLLASLSQSATLMAVSLGGLSPAWLAWLLQNLPGEPPEGEGPED